MTWLPQICKLQWRIGATDGYAADLKEHALVVNAGCAQSLHSLLEVPRIEVSKVHITHTPQCSQKEHLLLYPQTLHTRFRSLRCFEVVVDCGGLQLIQRLHALLPAILREFSLSFQRTGNGAAAKSKLVALLIAFIQHRPNLFVFTVHSKKLLGKEDFAACSRPRLKLKID